MLQCCSAHIMLWLSLIWYLSKLDIIIMPFMDKSHKVSVADGRIWSYSCPILDEVGLQFLPSLKDYNHSHCMCYVVKVPNGRRSQVADGHLGLPQMGFGHLGLGSNVQSSYLMINLLMIGCLSLGLSDRWTFGVGLNGHRPLETVGHFRPMQRGQFPIFVVFTLDCIYHFDLRRSKNPRN